MPVENDTDDFFIHPAKGVIDEGSGGFREGGLTFVMVALLVPCVFVPFRCRLVGLHQQ